jgi:hypothetical protein
MATRAELETSLRRVRRRELTGMDLLPGEPRAAFSEQDAAQAVEQHRADTVAPHGKTHERWGFAPGPGLRPTPRERGLK